MFVIICSFLNITLIVTSWIICLAVIIRLLCNIKLVISKVPILLILNTYVAMFSLNTMMFTFFDFNVYENMNPGLTFDDPWCDMRVFLAHSSCASFYYSCVLQATFRLFRVVFYKNKFYQSRRFFVIAIVVQWTISFILVLPNLLPDDYAYVPEKHKCWLPFERIRGLAIAFLLIYIIPLAWLIFIYIYIIHYVRRSSNLQQRQQQANARDIIVLKRIVTIICVTVGIGVPTLLVFVYYIFTRYTIPYAYDIQDISFGSALLATTVAFTTATPETRKLIKFRSRQIHPAILQRSNPNQRTHTHRAPMGDSQ